MSSLEKCWGSKVQRKTMEMPFNGLEQGIPLTGRILRCMIFPEHSPGDGLGVAPDFVSRTSHAYGFWRGIQEPGRQ